METPEHFGTEDHIFNAWKLRDELPKPYYEKDGIVIYNSDCRLILPHLPKVDLVLTDPPYGVKMDKGFGGSTGFGGQGISIERRQYDQDWDSERPSQEVFNMILKSSPLALIWGGNFFADMLPQSTHWVFWDKLQTMPTFGDGELAWTNFKRSSIKKVTVPWNGLQDKEESRHYPTQKPLKLMTWCINHAPKAETICDPFMGSGTTLEAAKLLGKKCIGIEMQEKYCEIAALRLSQEVMTFD